MYPEIMVIPMREELTRLGIEELRTAEEVDRALKAQPGTAGDRELDLRLRRRTHAARRAHGSGKGDSSRPRIYGICRAGHGSHGTRARLFHGAAAVFAFDRHLARRATRLHDAAPRHRIARGARHRCRTEGGVRQVLRAARNDALKRRNKPSA